jgi:spermidine synthase
VSYYHRTGPIGDIFDTFGKTNLTSQVGVIGLGAGAIAAYATPGEHFTFYEIDPAIERIARDPRYFTFFEEAEGSCDIVLGDGRLTMAEAPDGGYGLIILDAFSSDAIPTHLLTREALALYLEKLDPEGVLVFHISNRYLNLKPVLATLAADAGLNALGRDDLTIATLERRQGKSPSQYVAMARDADTLAPLARRDGWNPLRPRPGVKVWNDQHSSILSLFRWD